MGKYRADNLLPMFEMAAALRNDMLKAGFTDNGGAIHSAERIIDILGQRVCYPLLTHSNNLKRHPNAERTQAADDLLRKGENASVKIEHVSPQRALTRLAIDQLKKGGPEAVIQTLLDNYRLVLLSSFEMAELNRVNRSELQADRLQKCGLEIVAGVRPPWPAGG